MKKILLGSLLILGLCATSYQPVEARTPANVVKAIGNGAENIVVGTGALTTVVAAYVVKLVTVLAYGTTRTAEEAIAFTWNHKYALTLMAIGAYATYIAMVTGLNYQEAYALVLKHKNLLFDLAIKNGNKLLVLGKELLKILESLTRIPKRPELYKSYITDPIMTVVS